MGCSVSLMRMYECDSSSFHVCLAAALIKFLGGTPGATGAITLRTCVRAAAPQQYVFIWLNKCVEQVSRENISIKVLHFNRVRASWPFICTPKEPALNAAGHDERWGTSLRAGISARQHSRTSDNRTPKGRPIRRSPVVAQVAANRGERDTFAWKRRRCLENRV